MTDEKAKPQPRGFVVVTPRGVQQGADDREGSATRPEGAEQPPRTPEQEQAWQEVLATNRARRASPEWQAEQKRKEEQLAYSASVVFADMDWYYDNVLSWIAYRNPRLIEQGFSGLRYDDSPDLIERDPRSVLRLALQNGKIVARRNIGGFIERVSQDEWLAVRRITILSKWPKLIVFNSDEVKALWKPIITIDNQPLAVGEANRAEGYLALNGPRRAEKTSPWRIKDLDLLKSWITINPMPQGATRDEFEKELKVRYGAVDRALARTLHKDPQAHPNRPGKGPRNSAKSLGKK